jgi:hypothetical protein
MGKAMIAAAIAKDFNSVILMFDPLKYRASSKQVLNLANSEGCNLKPPPKFIQAWLPPTLRPITSTTTNNRLVIT